MALLTGGVIGYAALVRPIALGVGVLLAGLLLALRWQEERRRWGALAACLLLGNVVVLLPWEVWVWQQTHKWIPLSTGGPVSVRDGLTCFLVTKGYRRPLPFSPAVREVIEDAIRRREDEKLRTMRQISAFLRDQLAQNPREGLQLFAWKAARAWYGTDAQHAEERWLLLIQSGYLLLALGGGILMWRHDGLRKEYIALATLLVVYF